MDARLPFVLAMLAIAPAAAALPAHSGSPAGWSWAGLWSANAADDLAAAARTSVACVLGDVDGDGARDLLLRTKDETGARLQALAGPDHTRVIWDLALDASAKLDCAPDAAGDGVADPIVKLLGDASSEIPANDAPVGAASAQATLQALDGATGSATVALEAAESARGAEAAALAGGSKVETMLSSGAKNVYLFVSSETTEATTSLPLIELLVSSRDADVRIEVLDAKGEVQGVIEGAPGSEIIAHASVADVSGARVLVLSTLEASPVDQAPAQAASLAAHAPDGSVLWTVELDSKTDDVLLIPLAGDLDGDGVQDAIAQTVPADLRGGIPADAAGSVLLVVSGADGSEILSRASAASEMIVALPLGDVTSDANATAQAASAQVDALLVVTQSAPDAAIVLECVVAGETCWTAELPARARPVAGILDEYTGHLRGFADITGDGVADLAAIVEAQNGSELQTLSGVDGRVAWSVAASAEAQVRSIAGEAGSKLAVLEQSGSGIALRVLDGATGAVEWAGSLEVPASIPEGAAELTVEGEGIAARIIVTVATLKVELEAAAQAPEHVYVIDPATGQAEVATTTLEGAEAPPPFTLQTASAEASTIAQTPGLGLVGLAVALAGAVALSRRRHA